MVFNAGEALDRLEERARLHNFLAGLSKEDSAPPPLSAKDQQFLENFKPDQPMGSVAQERMRERAAAAEFLIERMIDETLP